MNWVIIGSVNGLSPVRHQAITWTNAGLLSIELLGTYFSEIWIGILSFLFQKMQLKMSSGKMAAILSRGRGVNGLISTVCSWHDKTKLGTQDGHGALALGVWYNMKQALAAQVWFWSSIGKLTLNMLNCFKDYLRCIHITHHFLDFVQHK